MIFCETWDCFTLLLVQKIKLFCFGILVYNFLSGRRATDTTRFSLIPPGKLLPAYTYHWTSRLSSYQPTMWKHTLFSWIWICLNVLAKSWCLSCSPSFHPAFLTLWCPNNWSRPIREGMWQSDMVVQHKPGCLVVPMQTLMFLSLVQMKKLFSLFAMLPATSSPGRLSVVLKGMLASLLALQSKAVDLSEWAKQTADWFFAHCLWVLQIFMHCINWNRSSTFFFNFTRKTLPRLIYRSFATIHGCCHLFAFLLACRLCCFNRCCSPSKSEQKSIAVHHSFQERGGHVCTNSWQPDSVVIVSLLE